MLSILHITDLHFGKQTEEIFGDKEALAQSVVRAAKVHASESTEKCLVVSGDLVYKGNASSYEEVRLFIETLRKLWGAQSQNVIICPGNHDIVHSSNDPFHPINQIIFEITHRGDFTFKKKTSLHLPTELADFFVINSSFHYQHEYGLVDLETLPLIQDSSKLKVAVLHHHLFGMNESDNSHIRNLYPLMIELFRRNIQLILHGHQHIIEDVYIGNPSCRVVGAGSLNFKNSGALNNQFNLITMKDNQLSILRFIWLSDLPIDGRIGGWKELHH